MDRRHHTIQLSTAPGSAPATQPRDDGMMSSKLYLAACGGRNEEAVALLVADQAAGIHQVSAERNNVLHLAAEQGHGELIRELYDRFGDRRLLSSRNSALDTPLHCAARAGHDWTVSLLIQLARGCGEETILSCKNKAGDTALHLAARLGHGKAVEVMVNAAPELASEVNNDGVSPLYLAVMSRSMDTVKAITTSCSHASAAGLSLQNALHAALFQGSEMVSLLLDWKPCGPSLASEPDGSGSTPLHFASSDGDPTIVSAILDANPYAARMQDSDGLSALHVAAGMGHARVIEALMEVEACPDAAELRDNNDRTFIHAAARGGHRKVVWLAIRKPTLHGLLNVQDVDGNTPLHLAVLAGASDVVEYLMWRVKVRTDVMNKEGYTPLDLAARSTSFFTMLGLVATLAAFGGQSRPQRRDQVEKWNNHDIAKGIEKMSESLAVVAVLIATVAFTAANSVPGSYEQADDKGKMVFEGMAVLQRNELFKCFLVLDSFALVTSVMAVVLLVFGKASRSSGSWKSFALALHCLWASLISIIMAFYAALSAVTTTRAVSLFAYLFIYYGFFVLFYVVNYLTAPPVALRTLWKALWRTMKGRNIVFRRRIKQQYPVASTYALNLVIFQGIGYLAFVGTIVISSLSEKVYIEATRSVAVAPAPSMVLS